jgi:hypothetical protein
MELVGVNIFGCATAGLPGPHPYRVGAGGRRHPNPPSASSGTGQYGELMARQQVVELDVVAGTQPGQEGREQQPDNFGHVPSIADPSLVRGFAAPQPQHTC